MQFGPLTLKRCRYGWMLFCGHYIGKCFDLYGEYSESEVAAMRGFVRAGDVVLDIGANIGDLTLPLAQMVGVEGCVYAIESHPEFFNILCGNLALNQIQNVRPMNVFVKNSETAPVMQRFVGKGAAPKAVKIDEMGLEKCRLIKIDVDGNELDVLQSGEATIKRLRPIVYFENDVREKSKELLDYLFALNYTLYWHVAPICAPINFFGNPVNHWDPDCIVSLMVLAVPKETGMTIAGLAEIRNSDEWVVSGVSTLKGVPKEALSDA